MPHSLRCFGVLFIMAKAKVNLLIDYITYSMSEVLSVFKFPHRSLEVCFCMVKNGGGYERYKPHPLCTRSVSEMLTLDKCAVKTFTPHTHYVHIRVCRITYDPHHFS